MKTYKFLYIFSLGMLFTLTASILYAYYLAFFPVKDIEVQIPPTGAEIVNAQPLTGGDNIFYKITLCNHIQPRMEIIYSLVSVENELEIPVVIIRPSFSSSEGFEDSNVPVFQPCSAMIDGSVRLPDNTPTGTYILGVNIVTRVNLLRRQTLFFETEPFRVQREEVE